MIASETKEIIRNATWHRRKLTQWIDRLSSRTQEFSKLSRQDRVECRALRAACDTFRCELLFWRANFFSRLGAPENIPYPSRSYAAEFRALRKNVQNYLSIIPLTLIYEESDARSGYIGNKREESRQLGRDTSAERNDTRL